MDEEIEIGPGEPNPDRVNACEFCGSYRADKTPPYLHHPGCPKEHDLQLDPWIAEQFPGPSESSP